MELLDFIRDGLVVEEGADMLVEIFPGCLDAEAEAIVCFNEAIVPDAAPSAFAPACGPVDANLEIENGEFVLGVGVDAEEEHSC